MIRSLTCWQCTNMGISDLKNGRPYKCICKVTKHWGKLERGRNCKSFEYKQWHNEVAPDGIPIKNRQPLDFRTEKQWEEEGRYVIDKAAGVEMYPSKRSMKKTYKYYLIENTEIYK